MKKPQSFWLHPVLPILALSFGGWLWIINTGTALEVLVLSVWLVIISFKALLDFGKHVIYCNLYETVESIKATLQVPVLEIEGNYSIYKFVAPSKEIIQKYHDLKTFACTQKKIKD